MEDERLGGQVEVRHVSGLYVFCNLHDTENWTVYAQGNGTIGCAEYVYSIFFVSFVVLCLNFQLIF